MRNITSSIIIALAFALIAGTAGAAGPLKPPDNSSPRATFESFLTLTEEAASRYHAFRNAPSPATQEALWQVSQKAARLFDLSKVGPSARPKVADQTFYLLWDVIARLELPDLVEIPAVSVDEDNDGQAEQPMRWRIPDTEITIARISEGEHAGEFRFSPDTVKDARRFYEAVLELPYRRPMPVEDIYHLNQLITGWMIPMAWVEALPGWANTLLHGQVVWKWIALAVLMGLALGAAFAVYRWSRRKPWTGTLGRYLRYITELAALRPALLDGSTTLTRRSFEMKTKLFTSLAALAAMSTIVVGACSESAPPPSADNAATAAAPVEKAAPPTMKMTTEIPAEITIPDRVDSRIGTLTFEDGFPTEETAKKIYDQLDFQRAVESVMMTTPAASLTGFRNGIRKYGPDNETAIIWPRMDSKVQLLTPNTTVIYLFLWLDLKDGPMVVEAPPNVLGLIDDFWFRYVTDFGLAGPDKGKGGKYVILPPGYQGEVPTGYHVAQSQTYGNWLLIRGFLEDGDAGPGLKNIKDNFKLYPLGKTASASKVKYHDISMKYLNTIHASDATYFEEINKVVQEEPSESQSPEILGLLASIGIEKGKPFKPDARMQKILKDAANVGSAAARVVLYRNRDAEAKVYPNSGWEHPWIGGSHTFMRNGARLIDARTRFHMYATGITPAMVTPKVGSGTQYIAGMRDSKGRPFDGSKTYKVNLPPNVPAKQFWAFTVYNVQTRSMLQTDQKFPEITSAEQSVKKNPDGSYDVYFGPKAPKGKESNWIQTVPGMGWHMLFRLYGPEKAWFDKTWRPSEVELVE